VKQRRATLATKEYLITEQLALLLTSHSTAAEGDDPFLLNWLGEARIDGDFHLAFQRWAEDLNLTTTRIVPGRKERLPLSAYRFRRTIATMLADNGASPEEIAEFLDDASIAMALVYTSTSSNIVDVLRDTLDKHPSWFRLIDAFLGRIATRDDAALPHIIGGAPQLMHYARYARRIGVIGQCALQGLCELMPPLSCYSCVHFRARGRSECHELQLQQLIDDVDSKIGIESDRVVGAIRNDVCAVLAVIARLRETEGQASHVSDRRSSISRRIASERPQ